MPDLARFDPPPTREPQGPFGPGGQSQFGAFPPPGPTGGWTRGFYPLEIGRVVSLTFSLFRFGWRTFIAIGLVTMIPVAIVTALVSTVTYGSIEEWQRGVISAGLGTSPPQAAMSSFPFPALALSVVAAALVGPISMLGGAAVIDATVAIIRGDRPQASRSLQAAVRRLRDLLVIYLAIFAGIVGLPLVGFAFPMFTTLGPGGLDLPAVALFVGLVAFVALFALLAYVLIRVAFAVQALMVEDIGATPALRRSWHLIGGSMWRVLGYGIAFSLIVGLLGAVFGILGTIVAWVVAPPTFAPGTYVMTLQPAAIFVQTLLTGIIAAFLASLPSIGMTLLYFDIRWRKGESAPVPGGSDASPNAGGG